MSSVKKQALFLAAVLFLLGVASIVYQRVVQKVPLHQSETDPVWIIDAQVQFQAKPNKPVKARMFVPTLDDGFTILNESFISNNYGVNVNEKKNNRYVTWSARRADGTQYLYYRLMMTERYSSREQEEKGPQYRNPPVLEGAEKLAADALRAPILGHSADVETYIGETIKRVNDFDDDNVQLLLGSDLSARNRARVVSLLLGLSHIPAEPVHVLALKESQYQEPELWLRSFNGQRWLYFNPETGREGLPDDRLLWWRGNDALLQLEGGRYPVISFSVHRNEMGAVELARALRMKDVDSFIDFSLYELPLPAQQLYKTLIMIPVGVLLVLLCRSLVGVQTLGTFTPVLVALAFRETQIIWGVLLFTFITAMGLMVRAYLEHLKLQLMARLSVVLTFVVMFMAILSLLGYKLGVGSGLSVALFPMVILTMVIERTSIAWEERGGSESMRLALATLAVAVLCHLLMVWDPLVYFVFTFPGVLLCLAAAMVLMGHYRGYRLSELVRFRAMAED